MEKEMCSRCKYNESQPEHHCPYEIEMTIGEDNDDFTLCDCCDDCESICMGDI